MNQLSNSGNAKLSPERPRITFESITFSDGQTFELDDDQIVVFVGPNNAGKSAALKELANAVGNSSSARKIVTHLKLRRTGNSKTLRDWLEFHSMKQNAGTNQYTYSGMGYSISHSWLNFFEGADERSPVAPFFYSRLGTETRLTDSNAAGAIRLHFDPPAHPIHSLLADEKLAKTISEYFEKAFNQELIAFRAGGSTFPLLVGRDPQKLEGEDDFSKSYVDRLLAAADLLELQGDGMRSFASVLLRCFVTETFSVQFLDEPEAFLHPPQARLLGQLLARDRRSKAQLFIATHSPEVLEGVLAGNLEKVRIIRIQREGAVNRVRELSKERTAAIANNPLTRYSRVFAGIFHQRVIIAESDSDCLFYNSILNVKAVVGDLTPDVLFIHAGGKHRMGDLAETLRLLDVPVSIIADIDLINDEISFRKVF